MEAGGGRRRGRGQRLLYWFRTPPGVRVGRAALDDEAIQLIERHNPDIQFDWARLLKESAPEPPRRERDGREGRDSRDRDRRDRRDTRQPRPRAMETSAAAAPPMPTPEAAEEMQELAEAADVRAAEHAEEVLAADSADFAEETRSAAESADFAEETPSAADSADFGEEKHLAAESAEHAEREPIEPEAGEVGEPPEAAGPREPVSAAASRLGPDGVSRLRTRYLDLKTRLGEKEDLEAPVKVELAEALERLNPDAWHSSAEVSVALEQYESIFERLRSVIGRHPRRRV